jgi:hypothetical protein
MLHVDGNRIGAALSEVESHCTESGQSAQQAFGDPVEYARSLHLPAHGHESTRALLRSSAPSTLQVLGMVLLTASFADWLRGQQLEITTGILVNGSVVLLASVAIAWFVDPALRMIIYHPILVWLEFMASTAAFVLILVFLDEVICQVSAGWSLAAGGGRTGGGRGVGDHPNSRRRLGRESDYFSLRQRWHILRRCTRFHWKTVRALPARNPARRGNNGPDDSGCDRDAACLRLGDSPDEPRIGAHPRAVRGPTSSRRPSCGPYPCHDLRSFFRRGRTAGSP